MGKLNQEAMKTNSIFMNVIHKDEEDQRNFLQRLNGEALSMTCVNQDMEFATLKNGAIDPKYRSYIHCENFKTFGEILNKDEG